MANFVTMRTWDGIGKWKSQRGYDIELWQTTVRMMNLIDKEHCKTFTPEEIRYYGGKEEATYAYFRELGEAGRTLKGNEKKAKVLKTFRINVVTPFIEVPPKYRDAFLGVAR